MGNSHFRQMDYPNPDRSNANYDPDPDIAQLLQYLIRSGQVHIIASDRDDSSDDEIIPPPSPPKVPLNPNTDALDKSEFKFYTEAASGFIKKTGQQRPTPLAALIAARERGLPGGPCFTQGDRCRIMNRLLPNVHKSIDEQHSKIFCGTFSRDGHSFLTASQDKKLRIYDSSRHTYTPIKTIMGQNVGWSILDTAFSPDGEYVAYSSWSESIHLCPISGDKDEQESLLMCPDDRRFCIFSLTFSSDGNEILCGANDGCIYIYNRTINQRQLKIVSHDDDVNTVAFADETSQIVYSGGDDGIVKVWDRRTLSEADPIAVGYLAGHMDGITFIESRGDGRHLLSNSKDQSIKLWDIRRFSSEEGVVHTKRAVSEQSWDYRWQSIPKAVKNLKKKLPGDSSIMTYCGHSVLQTLCRCHFSPSFTTGQRYIYTGCATGRVVVYDALTGKVAFQLSGHRACVRDVAWHPFRPEIVSTSWDGNICQWTYLDTTDVDDVDISLSELGSRSGRQLRRSLRIMERNNRLLRANNGPYPCVGEERRNS